MAVMPSDHVISPDSVFQQAIAAAAQLVERTPGRIATFGIRPSYAAEIFGYIERGAAVSYTPEPGKSPLAVHQVRQFREKPKLDVAREYLASGNFYWNAGIFVWSARTILDALAKYQPEMYAHLQRIADAEGKPDYQQTLEREFAAIKGVSIDYAVMEHAKDIVVVEAPFQWDDIGSWQAMARLQGADDDGNTILAKHAGLNTKGTIVRGPDDHLIVTLGVTDTIVVHTPNATLVANKHDEEAIRQLVKLIAERGWGEHL
jgi:mannose-1-phosphate guanylyltransferase